MSLKKWLPFLLAFVLPLVAIYAWWGGFNPVRIDPGQTRGPYTYAYLEHTGDFAKLPDLQGRVAADLAAQHVPPGEAITVLYSDPQQVRKADRLARTGYLVPAGTKVEAPLKVDSIPARRVLVVRVRTAVLLAPSRAYQALYDYLSAHGRTVSMPTVELYAASGSPFSNGTLSVEMPESADEGGAAR